ncbi:hypothetical protein [Propionivibrio sp.]|uniref:hypothetical protein n=1 Tax=Propionivibrio sp. TaxID=2212460 RepID=UPI0026199333|nr:hypothetical protein [Propionivibrio sp.]
MLAAQELRQIEKIVSPASPLSILSAEDAEKMLAEHDNFSAIVDAALAVKAESKPKVSIPALACTIEAAIESYMANKSGTAKSTQSAYRRRLNVFAQLAGGANQMLHDVSPVQCVRISEALQLLPRHEREISCADEILAKPPEGKPIAKPTVKEYLILIQDFFDWAIGTLRYPKGDNPFAGIVKPSEGSHGGTGDGAEAFTDSELEQIFQPTFFSNMKRPYQFWGPLIALFTGARANEIAQLRVIDIVRENGVLCMDITHEPNHPVPTRTKNPASERRIP